MFSLSIAHFSLCSIIEKGKVLSYAYSQIRRDGVEEVTETDEVSFQEVRPYIIPIWRSVWFLPSIMFQATMDSIGGASVTSDLTFEAGPPGKIEVFSKNLTFNSWPIKIQWKPICVFRWNVMLSIRRLAKTKRPSVTSIKLLVRNPWNSLCIVYCMGFITKTLLRDPAKNYLADIFR